jgi:starch-binding outer membrane protein, SusD/RagB family
MQLNKIKYHVWALLGMMVITTSCSKDFLDKKPYDSVSADDAITNIQDMQAALSGTYASLRAVSLYGRDIILFGDMTSDNLYISANNSNRALDFFQLNYIVTNATVETIWKFAYSAILNANNVINSTLETSPEVEQLRGEAYAIRALMYFELIKFFAKPYTVDPTGMGVPIILEYKATYKPGRNTTTEVYNQIEADLNKAVSLITEEKSSGFFTKYAATALLARMYQFKGDWTNALAKANDVIDNSGYSLLSHDDVEAFWGNNTDRDDKVESLFEVVVDVSGYIFDATGNAGKESLPYLLDQAGYGDVLASEDLYDSYSATDVRRNLITVGSDQRGPDVKVVAKFPNSGLADPDDIKVIRLSEVYLIAAEAAYHLNNETDALDFVNAIATDRDPAFAGYSSTGTALLDDILIERRKELAFEGHRYWDLARNNRDVVRVNLDGNYLGVPLTLPADNFRRILPIPQKEMDANQEIRGQQNDGY